MCRVDGSFRPRHVSVLEIVDRALETFVPGSVIPAGFTVPVFFWGGK